MKTVRLFCLSLLLLGLSTSAVAAADDFYTGVQLGESKVDRTSGNLNVKMVPLQSNPNILVQGSSQTSVDNDGFGGRAYLGYTFTPHIAVEGGYTQYASTKVNNIYGMTGKDAQLSEGAIDTIMKFTLPVSKKISLYADGGASFVMTKQLDDAYAVSATEVHYQENSIDRLRPTYGGGINYDIASYLSSDLSLARVIGGDGVPTSNLLALGLNLHFSSNTNK